MAMVSAISREPTFGELMVGTGGCRKVRFPGKGKGKSGGYRTIHYFAAEEYRKGAGRGVGRRTRRRT